MNQTIKHVFNYVLLVLCTVSACGCLKFIPDSATSDVIPVFTHWRSNSEPHRMMQASVCDKVIDDEEFEAKLAAIIERDYFPDVKGLQNRLEWSEAAESRDPEKIANAQRNIVLRRAGFSVRCRATTSTRLRSYYRR